MASNTRDRRGGATAMLFGVLILALFPCPSRCQFTIQLEQTLYQPALPEEQPVGSPVVTVVAFYFDSFGRLFTDGTFALSSSQDAGLFTVETESTATQNRGIVLTAEVLDRDAPGAQTEFQFDVVYSVADGSQSASAQIQVFLDDVNDNAPRFTERVFDVTVFEETEAGVVFFTLTANDSDLVIITRTVDDTAEDFGELEYTVDNGRIIYSITAGNDLSHFVVNPDTGGLSVSPGFVLDVDAVDFYNLSVMAVDGGGLTDNATVLISVLDSNDNQPQILSPLGVEITIPEDTPLGFEIVDAINATDIDRGQNAEIQFFIAEGDITDSFNIDIITGRITVSAPLDREEGSVVNLRVVAQDRGVPPLQDAIYVVVNLLDINDYVPQFVQPSYEASVNENSGIGISVVQIEAVDLDEGSNGTVTYSIIGSTGGEFLLDAETGIIYTNKTIDREQNASFLLQIEAADNPENETFQLSAVVDVSITINDINDNPPVFANESYEAHILDTIPTAEGIVQILATDLDSGSNAEIEYRFEVSDPSRPNDFRINPNTGIVFRNRPIRFQEQSVYTYTIRALDNGGFRLQADVDLTIYIYDVNIRRPRFEMSEYNATLNETEGVGEVILKVTAVDRDPGPIGDVRYRIITEFDEAGSFSVNETSGEIAVATRLDFDFRTFIFFQVEAYDGGFPEPFTDVTNITVYLLGLNDEAPSIVFSQGFLPTVPENEQPPIAVVTLSDYTSDPDFGRGSEFVFSIHEIYDEFQNTSLCMNESSTSYSNSSSANETGSCLPLPTFTINETTGLITSHRVFDREEQPEGIIVTINTTDFGSPQQSKLTNITILIGDKNDQSPYFSYNASGTAYEFTPPGALVISEYQAIDEDIGPNAQLEYEIFAGDEFNRFFVDSQNGSIFTAKVLNKTVEKYYNLTIIAMDGGIPQLFGSGTVFIEVLDANDQVPVFSEDVYTASFYENSTMGTFLLQVNATDSDIGTNANFEYLFAPNSSDRFQINNTTGEIITYDTFDRELESFFELTVFAIDKGVVPLTGSATVFVYILDNNDFAPTFNESLYTASVIENAPMGEYLTTVFAYDLDATHPSNAIRYSLRGNRSGELEIDPLSGDVTVGLDDIDWEKGANLSVFAVATDLGNPPQSAEAEIMVFISDINDQPPEFVPESLNLTVSESAVHGTEVGYVIAVDPDSLGNNSRVIYSVLADFSNGRFELDSESGLVRFVMRAINREQTPFYQLLIRASDFGSPQMYSDAILTVAILDSNDFGPVFDQTLFTATVLENTPPGFPILTVSATDQDVGSNAELRYSIPNTTYSQFFTMNETSGVISTGSVSLDFETKVTYAFNIFVSDSGISPFNATSMVEITVLDSNDHSPVFTESEYSAAMRENLAPGTTVLRVQTTDVDTGDNEDVEFSIRGIGSQYFDVHSETGVLYTIASINREETPSFNLTMVASNSQADIPLSTETQVIVNVTDLNDMHPSFDFVTELFVPENTTMGEVFYILEADDGDEGDNGTITYTIIRGNGGSEFQLDSQTGEFRLNKTLDFEATPSYMMYIMATDSGLQNLSNYTNVLINVLDSNDNGPIFANTAYEITVNSEVDIGTTVGRIIAFDIDEGTNAQISYNITMSNDQGLFQLVSSDEATIITTTSLSSQASQSFVLILEATDSETMAISTVTVNVQRAVSSLPYFTSQTFEATIDEDHTTGQLVIDLSSQAVNADDFVIESGDSSGLFSISLVGVLTLASPGLDYESRSVYQLSISIANTAGNQAYTIVTIFIRDVNEYPPEFILDPFFAVVSETTPLEVPFFRAVATDNDGSSPANTITYSIVSTDILTANTFDIDPLSGDVSLRRTLDYELGGDREFILDIRATNLALFAETTVNITVLNGNSFDPRFDQFSYTVLLREDDLVDINIVNVSATDRDIGSQGEITYGLLGDHRQLDFRIDTFTGEVFTNYPLDYERQAIYTLVAVAADGGNPSRSSTAAVVVYITDLNDNFPVWEQTQYFTVTAENTTIGGSVIQVLATDLDQSERSQADDIDALRAQNGYVTYNISDGDPNGFFQIDPDSGLVTVAASLDRETFPNFTLTLNATDGGGQYSNAYLHITVRDSNDELPKFSEPVFTVGIPEDSPNGTFIFQAAANDSDLNQNAIISYQIGGGNINEAFQINSSTGIILLDKSLDRETVSSYVLILEAVDMGEPRLTGLAQLVVDILDINEFEPVFDSDGYSVELLENRPTGYVVLQVGTSDMDFGENATSLFSIVPSFIVNETAAMGNFSTSMSNGNVSNSTDFSNSTSFGNGTSFGNFSNGTNASDDGDYSTVSLVEVIIPFDINVTSGEVFVIDQVDFELEKEYHFIVMATDSGPLSEQLSSQVNVSIFVLDDNDNPPVFDQESYSIDVREDSPNGASILSVSASDIDSGSNAEFSFSLDYLGDPEAEGSFVVEPQTGIISLSDTSNLDYERTRSYQLLVNATDFGLPSQHSSVLLSIDIVDANDNFPQFSDAFFEGSISENLPPGSPAGEVFASDRDESANALVVYNITRLVTSEAECMSDCSGAGFCSSIYDAIDSSVFPRVPPFYIDSQSGRVFSSIALDRENISDYVVLVTAQDSAINETQLSNTTCIHVAILDVNDEIPTFTEPIYFANFSEYTGRGFLVTQVFATDRDISSNADIQFQLLSEMDSFTIHPQNGRIFTLIDVYDRESRETYIITVSAEDEGDPAQSSTATVVVTILDENDSPPTFSQSLYLVSSEENLPSLSPVLQLNATDADIMENAEIEYTITSVVPENHFQVDRQSGLLSTTQSLDRENIASYLVTIQATDNGFVPLSGSTVVNVTILDVNDNQPRFIGAPFAVEIDENFIPSDPILTITAQDNDIGTNAVIVYLIRSIEPPIPDGVLTLNETTGDLSLISPLDAEYSLQLNITVVASNGPALPPQESETVAVIEVGDKNDNTPQFAQMDYIIPISEALEVGAVFLQLGASDLDSTSINSVLQFDITGGQNTSLFAIDQHSGNLSVASPLDRETESTHVLEVSVSDGGTPILSSNTTVTIILQDINDNDPVFEQSAYMFSVTENQPPFTLIGRVRANDIDINVVSYYIHENFTNDDDDLFVNSTTGELLSAVVLDREVQEIYSLVIVVTDNGQEVVRTAEVTVNVTIIDENDVAPFFLAAYERDWNENTTVGTVLLTVEAGDLDRDQNGMVVYSLIPSNDSSFFAINATSGDITLELQLDRESQDRFEFVVQADDLGFPSLSGNTTVVINVLDYNDNTPVLNSTQYVAVLPEDTRVGSAVVYIGASDADIDRNAEISFQLGGNFDDTFSIDPVSGVVNLTKTLDYEFVQNYTFSVSASDNGSEPLSSSSEVFVEVVDLNDNPPVFDSTVYQTSIPENAVLHTSIFNIPATDADSTSNAALRYTILSGNTEAKFSTGEASGIISLSDYLDREITPFYSLIIRAVDLGTPQLTATVELEVTVVDVNDNAPEFTLGSYYTLIPENTVTGANIVTVEANDLDALQNANLSYSIVSGSGNGTFEIDAISGEISVAKMLDYETTPSYTLSVSVSDNGSPEPFTDTSLVYITITDVNEHPPTFVQSTYYVDIPETAILGSPIGYFIAADADIYAQTQIMYSLSNLTEDSPFSVNEYEGTLFVRDVLEPGNDTFTLVASDGTYSTEVNISITVLPASFPGPIFFPTSFLFEISEAAPLLSVVGRITTTGFNASYLSLDPSVEEIFQTTETDIELVSKLDRESTMSYVFTAGYDEENVSTTVTVAVTDYNDFSPMFDSPVYELSISELTQIMTSLLTLVVTDRDPPGPNSNFQIWISGGDSDGQFWVDPDTGLLSVAKSLDYETVSQYTLTITAANHLSSPQLNSTTEVQVSLLDENDNDPIFSQMYYQVDISAGILSGSEVIVLEATDRDSSSNSELVYAITYLDVPYSFVINETSGAIATNTTFDPQAGTRTYLVSATVSDRGSPSPRSDTTTIFVTVTPVNAFSPVFSQPGGYSVEIPETTPLDGFVLQVSAVDPDTDLTVSVTYSITAGDPDGKFTVDPSTGVIIVSSTLDYVEQAFYPLIVEALDFGTPEISSIAAVNISVLDVNNHDPEFELESFEAFILENATAGSFVIQVLATDPDASSITHIITVNAYKNGTALFNINITSGEIYTTSPIDREFSSTFEILVSAIDFGYPVRRSRSVPVIVVLIDLNDSPPEFLQLEYGVLRLLTVGQPVTVVTAYNPDVVGGDLVYTITADSSGGMFAINETSGQVTALAAIPEVISEPYELTITAFDGVFLTSSVIYLNPISDGDFCEDGGFCTSVRSVNCTFDIFPYIECNPFCVGIYDLSPEEQVCVYYSCLNLSLVSPHDSALYFTVWSGRAPCATLLFCIPPNEACAGACPEGMSVCPTTNVCHDITLNDTCDGTNETCLAGQSLVQRENGERYCMNTSLLSANGQVCGNRGEVYCEALDICSSLTAQFLCQACPNDLALCSYTGECLPDIAWCCPLDRYYCDVLGTCLPLSDRCELPNIAPAIDSGLIFLDSVTYFNPGNFASPEYTIAFILTGDPATPALDTQNEEVSLAIVEIPDIPFDDGEWQYVVCGDSSYYGETCANITGEWTSIQGVSETNTLVLPSTARLRFVRRRIEFEGAVWLRVKLWDGNEDGYISPSKDIVQRSQPHYDSTIPYSNTGAFSDNSTLVTILIHPLITPPVFDADALFELSSIEEDVVFVNNRGNTVSEIVISVAIPSFEVLPEDVIEGFPSAQDNAGFSFYEQILPNSAREAYYSDVRKVNPTRKERARAMASGQEPGIGVIFDSAGNRTGMWQVSRNGDPRLFTDIEPLLLTSENFLLLNASSRLRFLPDNNFCGQASILIRAWDGHWNETLATELENSFIIANESNNTSTLSQYNLNEWVSANISVECILDKPIVYQTEVQLAPLPYQILHRYERLFTVLVAREISSLREDKDRLVDFLQLVLQQEIFIERFYPSDTRDSTYISFSVEENSLTFDEVKLLIQERMATLALLNFEILEISNDASYGSGTGCGGSTPQLYSGEQVNSIVSRFSSDADPDYLGMAVVGVSTPVNPQLGVWQYHRGNWTTTRQSSPNDSSSVIWVNLLQDLTETQSLLLHGADRIRFLPRPDFYWLDGEVAPSILVKAWDGSLGQLTSLPPPEIFLMNINTLSYVDTLQSLTNPIGLFSDSIATLKATRFGCDDTVNSGLIHDACCVCGGDGSSCEGCDGQLGSNMIRDSCDVCSGDHTSCLGCDLIPFSNVLPGGCGECVSDVSVPTAYTSKEDLFPMSSFKDCNDTCYGTALLDDCLICSGGSTDHQFNSDIDCAGSCFGPATIDDCGDCTGPGTSLSHNQNRDCTGVCGGPYVADSCGICQNPNQNGEIVENRDCAGVCYGGALPDSCGFCYGGTTNKLEDSTLDACGVCSGDNTTCLGCDGVVASGKTVDRCGDCGGNNCGCFLVDSVTPQRGPRTGGTEIIVYGSGFFLNDSSLLGFDFDPDSDNCGAPYRYPVTSLFIPITCLFAASEQQLTVPGIAIDQSRVQCVTGSTAQFSTYVPRFSLQIQLADDTLSNAIDFFYDDYSVISVLEVAPTDSEIQQNVTIVLTGENFINTSVSACLVYNFQFCVSDQTDNPLILPSTYISGSEISCQLPIAQTPCRVIVVLSLDGQMSGSITSSMTDFTYKYSSPVVDSIRFSDDLTNLIIQFDRKVELASIQPFSCETVFSEDTVFLLGGMEPTCYWTNDLQESITVDLPASASVKVGSAVSFKTGAIITFGQLYSYAVSGDFYIANSISPVAFLNGPESIPVCENVDFSSLGSLHAGYAGLEYKWSIFTEDSNIENFDEVIDYLDSLPSDSDSITLNTSLFVSNVEYYLELALVNSVGLQSELVLRQLFKDTSPRIHVYFLASTYGQVYETEDVLVQSHITVSECAESIGQLEFEWKLLLIAEPRQPLLIPQDLESVDVNSADIFIPANHWEQNSDYILVLTVQAEGSMTSVVEYPISVLPSPIRASIHGGNRIVAQNRSVILDARSSLENLALPTAVYTWSCNLIGSFEPCYNQSQSLPTPLAIPQASVVSILSTELQAGEEYNFTVTLTQGSEKSEASVTIEIVPHPQNTPFDIPIVEILPPVSMVISSQPTTIEGLVFSSLPTQSVYWESLNLPGGRTIDLTDPSIVQSQVFYPSLTNQSTSVTDDASIPLPSSIIPGQISRANLVLNRNVLTPGEKYTFQLTASSTSGMGSAHMTISAAPVPSSAVLSTEPQSGLALDTEFTLTVSDLDNSGDAPFLYRFGIIQNEGSSDASVSWLSGIQTDSSLTTFLPSGKRNRNFLITTIARIYDRDGGSSDVSAEVAVTPQSGTGQYNAILADITSRYELDRDWGRTLSDLVSLLTEIDSASLDSLMKEILDLFLDVFANRLPQTDTHYTLSASILAQITSGSGSIEVSEQMRIGQALQLMAEWFKDETSISQVQSDFPFELDRGDDPEILLSPERKATNCHLLPTSLVETILTSFSNMLSGERAETTALTFVQTTDTLAYALCQETVSGEEAQLAASSIADVYLQSAVPVGAFRVSNAIVNFGDSILETYNTQACPDDNNAACYEICFQSVHYEIDIFASELEDSQILRLSDGTRDRIEANIEGSDPESVRLISNVTSFAIPIPSQNKYLEVNNLPTPFQVLIPMPVDVFFENGSQPLCLYRNADSSTSSLEDFEWQLDTLNPPSTTSVDSTTYFVCEFDHLTEFAIAQLPPPVIIPPPITSSVTTPAIPTTSIEPTETSSETTSMPTTSPPPTSGSPVVGAAIAIIAVIVVVAVVVTIIVVVLWRKKKKRKLKIAPEEVDGGETSEGMQKAKLLKSGPLTPDESKILMNVIQILDSGGKETLGTMNVLPSVRLRELRNDICETYSAFGSKPFYFLTRQLCDITPAAEQQQFVSLVFGETENVSIFIREVTTKNEQTKLHFCICGKAAQFECSNCSAQGYCSPECQMEHWSNQHQKECTRLSERRRRSEVLLRRQSTTTLSPIMERPTGLSLSNSLSSSAQKQVVSPTSPTSPADWKSFMGSRKTPQNTPGRAKPFIPPTPAQRQPSTSQRMSLGKLAKLPSIPDADEKELKSPGRQQRPTFPSRVPSQSLTSPRKLALISRSQPTPMASHSVLTSPREAFVTPPARENMVSPPGFPQRTSQPTRHPPINTSTPLFPQSVSGTKSPRPYEVPKATPKPLFSRTDPWQHKKPPVHVTPGRQLSVHSVEDSSSSGSDTAASSPIRSTSPRDARAATSSRPPSLAPRRKTPSDVRLSSRSPPQPSSSSESESETESSSEDESATPRSPGAGAVRPGTSQQSSRSRHV